METAFSKRQVDQMCNKVEEYIRIRKYKGYRFEVHKREFKDNMIKKRQDLKVCEGGLSLKEAPETIARSLHLKL